MIYTPAKCISMERAMKVAKWGNSLAVRLPAELVAKLGVKEGDEVYTVPGMAEDSVTLKRKKTKEELWARLAEIRKSVKWPEDYKFDRNEIYEERFKNWPKHD
jgi:antitoxin MazE